VPEITAGGPTLVVGLGGYGVRVIVELKRRVEAASGGVRPENIRWLAIDTDTHVGEFLDRQEFLHLPVRERGKGPLEEEMASAMQYWRDQRIPSGGLGLPRPVGRLAFVQNFREVRKTLGAAVWQLNSQSRERGVRPAVYVVASLCGGTGGGMLLDTAYLLRRDVNPNAVLSGICCLEAVPGPMESINRANVCAALLELDYYFRPETEFVARYGVDEFRLRGSPFDRCYLMESRNDSGVSVEAKHLAEIAADRIFLDVQTAYGAMLASRCANVPKFWPEVYSAFGVWSLSIPFVEIMKACAARLAHLAVDSAIKPVGDFGEVGSDWISEMRPESLLSKLDVVGKDQVTTEKAVDTWFRDQYGRVAGIRKQDVLQYFREVTAEIEQSAAEDDGLAARVLATATAAVKRAQDICKPDGRAGCLSAISAFLSSAKRAVALNVATHESDIEPRESGRTQDQQARLSESLLRLQREMSGLSGVFLWRGQAARHLGEVVSYFRLLLERRRRRSAIDTYRHVLEGLESLERQWGALSNSLERVSHALRALETTAQEHAEADKVRRLLDRFTRDAEANVIATRVVPEAFRRIEERFDASPEVCRDALVSAAQELAGDLRDRLVSWYLGDNTRPEMQPSGFGRPYVAAAPNTRLVELGRRPEEFYVAGVNKRYPNAGRILPKGESEKNGPEWIDIDDPYLAFVCREVHCFALSNLAALPDYRRAYTEIARPGGMPLHWDDRNWLPPAQHYDPQLIPAEAELRVGNCLLKVTAANIIELPVTAIVCSRSRSLAEGSAAPDSVHGAIQRSGGREIDAEARGLGPLPHGGICVTRAGRLPAAYVIHAGMIDDIDRAPMSEALLERMLDTILEECERRKWDSIAIPLMGTRIAAIPEQQCAEIMFRRVAERLDPGTAWPHVLVFSVVGRSGLATMVRMATERRVRATTPLPPTPPAADMEEGSPRLRYAIESKFPYPVAKAFYQLRGAQNAEAELPQLENVLAATLQHLTVLALAEYLCGSDRSVELSELIRARFRQPQTLGVWLELLRETLRFLGTLATPAGRLVPDLAERYETGDTSLKAMADDLVKLRNRLCHPTPDALPNPQTATEFKTRLIAFLQSVAFLKDYPLICPTSSRTEGGVRIHTCRLLAGFHDLFDEVTVQCDIDLETGHVAMLNTRTGEVASLYPFYVLTTCPHETCGQTHLFRFHKTEKTAMEYFAAENHRLRDTQAGVEFKMLLQGAAPGFARRKASYLYLETSEQWQPLPPGHRIALKYEIVKRLRRGGMADVYEAVELGTGARLGMKVLPFQLLGDRTIQLRFRQEAQQARLLDHPNIVRVLDFGEDLVDHFLVMELAPGWKLETGEIALDVGELPKPLPTGSVVAILLQVAEALHYVHERQMVHRDIKPGNLLLFDHGTVKLADFGIARSRQGITLTMTGMAMGTPEYMSPEQAEATQELTPASDLYSLGIVAYELLTGKSPFRRPAALASMYANLRERVTPPSQLNPAVPEGLEGIVLRCLEKQPDKRYRSARELYQSLQALGEQASGLSPQAADSAG
jgi:eukaryotic-like serine/threonine-protein kinase